MCTIAPHLSYCQNDRGDAHCAPMVQALPPPKYRQIYLVLREQFAEGRYAAGVPGEFHPMSAFGVARITVRKALERLVADGLIERTPGRGSVALTRPGSRGPRRHLAPLTGLREDIVHIGLRASVKVVRCEVLPASGAVARELGLAPGA